MSDTVIKVENVSKQYRLGQVGTGTLSHDLNRLWHKVRGNEDPYLKIGEVNNRSQIGNSEYVWSLRNVSFEVKRGEVLGIIGKNGAGKSTLLKILSRVTKPTTGTIKTKGRIASLLEVGTGFHPELTGRENVFLNGAILGMNKHEIKDKFDEIVDFSGVERYIDTPVKRYSSGMYVRLAFAVAAHLEPEILIVDEVLAVGDAEFQKKCLGKMKDVSNSGRTVLFVSHNMTAVSSLCSRGILLALGKISSEGTISDVVNAYMAEGSVISTIRNWDEQSAPGDDFAKLNSVKLINQNYEPSAFLLLGGGKYGIQFNYTVLKPIPKPVPQIHFFTNRQDNVFISYGNFTESEYYSGNNILSPGHYSSVVWIPEGLLNTRFYQIGVGLSNMEKSHLHFWEEDTIIFEVLEDLKKRKSMYKGPVAGFIRPELEWENNKIE